MEVVEEEEVEEEAEVAVEAASEASVSVLLLEIVMGRLSTFKIHSLMLVRNSFRRTSFHFECAKRKMSELV